MRTVVHPHSGLMRAHWTKGEIRRNHGVDWIFTGGDITARHQPPARP